MKIILPLSKGLGNIKRYGSKEVDTGPLHWLNDSPIQEVYSC